MNFLIYGINPVLEALKSNPKSIEKIWLEKKSLSGKKHQILEKAKKLGIPVKVSENPPPKVPPHISTQGVVAYLLTFGYADLEDIVANWEKRKEVPLVVLLDEVEDPHNVGAIIRSADAAGAHGVVIPKVRGCEVTETVVKVSSGAVFNLPITKVTNLKHAIKFFKEKGLWVLGLTHKADQSIYRLDLKIPLVLIVGNEGRGIRPGILEQCDFLAKIPMKGKVESLNVSVATAIALFETLRQRSMV
ncbi:23S rRNA (guanosine(2251)-2'-O)-methyltransferase RlmB [Thermodesulfobacterium sp. TA1]|uniref:23S rRNA (guanosine(2251)-2'-O)-methyltransferase RlmB n=1 Tax=Thermodesulfobacterium sp. TA1 TaxID=2234087 RepID=UPI001231C51B|nr:23S rRNA (guanosine(2251)-2'-O)-methyltransferase RlmB [Thermodesulfobacterium sp. TA1]QER41613.1 23S rRNA (guanosine(2251)-2'-O)-methyltransferase RlmB [Thermodesulfobacterium sp. TA1]